MNNKKNRNLKKVTFSYGKNWQNYLKKLTKERIIIAKKSLKYLLGDVRNKTFLDVGSGSGLFSYSIYCLGAKIITSFDIDPFSVRCTKFLRNKVTNPEKWKIFHGSILDKNFISKLGKFDIVYSYGVLMTTGKMWESISNIISLVNDNGLLYIAIYNKTKRSKLWLKIKELYNMSPKVGKILMNFLYFFIFNFSLELLRFRNPFRIYKEYKKKRGMDIFIDIKDWLGGYPYEYATFDEVVNYIKNLNSNFKLVKYNKRTGGDNNEFLFQKIK